MGVRLVRLAVIAVVAHDLDAGRIGRDDEHRHAAVGRGVRVRDRHDDEESGKLGVRGEPFLAVDDPVAAVLNRGCGEDQRVGAALRLGDGEARHDLVFEQRLQIFFLLRRRTVMRQNFGISGVGRLRSEHDRPEPRASEQLVHQRELQLAVALAAELWPKMAGPEAALPHALLQRPNQFREQRIVNVPLIAEHMIERLDLVAHETVDPVELLLELRVSEELPRHRILHLGRMH